MVAAAKAGVEAEEARAAVAEAAVGQAAVDGMAEVATVVEVQQQWWWWLRSAVVEAEAETAVEMAAAQMCVSLQACCTVSPPTPQTNPPQHLR